MATKVGKWQGTTCLPTAVDLGFCASARLFRVSLCPSEDAALSGPVCEGEPRICVTYPIPCQAKKWPCMWWSFPSSSRSSVSLPHHS